MPKRKDKYSILLSLIFILIVATAIVALSRITNGFSSSLKSFYIDYNGKAIYNDTNNVYIIHDNTFKIKRWARSSIDYTVKIYAYGTEETDFAFQMGDEDGYSWYSDVVHDESRSDFTDYFDFQKDGDTFTLGNTNLKEILDLWSGDTSVSFSHGVPD